MNSNIVKLNGLVIKFGIVALFAVLVSSCANKSIDLNTAPSAVAGANFIQASPDAPIIDVYISGSKITSPALAYGQNTSYLTVKAGTDSTAFYNGSTNKKLFATTVNYLQNNTFSVFLVNKIAQADILLIADTLLRPPVGNASIRFVNVSPDAPAVDLVVKGGDVLVANKSFKDYTQFLPVTGDQNYTFEVHKAGTSTVLATLSNIKISSNDVYTIWFHGLVANTSTADQLSLTVYTNAFFL